MKKSIKTVGILIGVLGGLGIASGASIVAYNKLTNIVITFKDEETGKVLLTYNCRAGKVLDFKTIQEEINKNNPADYNKNKKQLLKNESHMANSTTSVFNGNAIYKNTDVLLNFAPLSNLLININISFSDSNLVTLSEKEKNEIKAKASQSLYSLINGSNVNNVNFVWDESNNKLSTNKSFILDSNIIDKKYVEHDKNNISRVLNVNTEGLAEVLKLNKSFDFERNSFKLIHAAKDEKVTINSSDNTFTFNFTYEPYSKITFKSVGGATVTNEYVNLKKLLDHKTDNEFIDELQKESNIHFGITADNKVDSSFLTNINKKIQLDNQHTLKNVKIDYFDNLTISSISTLEGQNESNKWTLCSISKLREILSHNISIYLLDNKKYFKLDVHNNVGNNVGDYRFFFDITEDDIINNYSKVNKTIKDFILHNENKKLFTGDYLDKTSGCIYFDVGGIHIENTEIKINNNINQMTLESVNLAFNQNIINYHINFYDVVEQKEKSIVLKISKVGADANNIKAIEYLNKPENKTTIFDGKLNGIKVNDGIKELLPSKLWDALGDNLDDNNKDYVFTKEDVPNISGKTLLNDCFVKLTIKNVNLVCNYTDNNNSKKTKIKVKYENFVKENKEFYDELLNDENSKNIGLEFEQLHYYKLALTKKDYEVNITFDPKEIGDDDCYYFLIDKEVNANNEIAMKKELDDLSKNKIKYTKINGQDTIIKIPKMFFNYNENSSVKIANPYMKSTQDIINKIKKYTQGLIGNESIIGLGIENININGVIKDCYDLSKKVTVLFLYKNSWTDSLTLKFYNSENELKEQIKTKINDIAAKLKIKLEANYVNGKVEYVLKQAKNKRNNETLDISIDQNITYLNANGETCEYDVFFDELMKKKSVIYYADSKDNNKIKQISDDIKDNLLSAIQLAAFTKQTISLESLLYKKIGKYIFFDTTKITKEWEFKNTDETVYTQNNIPLSDFNAVLQKHILYKDTHTEIEISKLDISLYRYDSENNKLIFTTDDSYSYHPIVDKNCQIKIGNVTFQLENTNNIIDLTTNNIIQIFNIQGKLHDINDNKINYLVFKPGSTCVSNNEIKEVLNSEIKKIIDNSSSTPYLSQIKFDKLGEFHFIKKGTKLMVHLYPYNIEYEYNLNNNNTKNIIQGIQNLVNTNLDENKLKDIKTELDKLIKNSNSKIDQYVIKLNTSGVLKGSIEKQKYVSLKELAIENEKRKIIEFDQTFVAFQRTTGEWYLTISKNMLDKYQSVRNLINLMALETKPQDCMYTSNLQNITNNENNRVINLSWIIHRNTEFNKKYIDWVIVQEDRIIVKFLNMNIKYEFSADQQLGKYRWTTNNENISPEYHQEHTKFESNNLIKCAGISYKFADYAQWWK